MKKIILVLSVISTLFFAGCDSNENVNDISENVSNQSQNEIVNNDEKTVKKEDETKEIVYMLFSGENVDLGYTYNFPYINIDSEDVKNMNSEIHEKLTLYKSDDFAFSQSIKYDYYINNNVLSVVVTYDDDDGSAFGVIDVYNVDIYTGKKLNSEEVLAANNIDIQKVEEKLQEAYDNVFVKHWIPGYLKDEFKTNKVIPGTGFLSEHINTGYSWYSLKTTIAENELYLDDEKNVIIKVYFPNVAGATCERVDIVNITQLVNGKGNDWYVIEDSDKNEIENPSIILEDFSNEELNIAYNEIFARHGHDFSSENLKEHFNSMLWYNVEEGKQVSLEELNDVEQTNASIIKSEIDNRKMLMQKLLNEDGSSNT